VLGPFSSKTESKKNKAAALLQFASAASADGGIDGAHTNLTDGTPYSEEQKAALAAAKVRADAKAAAKALRLEKVAGARAKLAQARATRAACLTGGHGSFFGADRVAVAAFEGFLRSTGFLPQAW
jgi:hypothetical protein